MPIESPQLECDPEACLLVLTSGSARPFLDSAPTAKSWLDTELDLWWPPSNPTPIIPMKPPCGRLWKAVAGKVDGSSRKEVTSEDE